MRDRNRDVLTIPLMTALVVLADQVTKHVVRVSLSQGESLALVPWLGSLFRVTYVTNSGAAFGLFPDRSHVFIIVAVVVIVILIVYYLQWSEGQWLVQLALGLQLGGAIGNLIDRLRFDGHVIDFIDLSFWPLRRWPVFNIADSSIVIGVVLLTLMMFWEEWHEDRTNRQLATARDE